ncbi:MAG: mannose-1-phosphate guanylyltransferase/mannose-6-phosphate isomerase [Pseudomonadota bacterium]|nr:mannose-1-phosphate guanylyltransferase/mannose-6-phosphate isomerase [Pseudomonadota bacterium]
MKLIPIILCGGSGTRLWPLSRDTFPKQFTNLRGSTSPLQETIKRCGLIKGISPPVLVCGEEHRFLVAEQLRSMGVDSYTVLLEPVAKNTAPALAYAANYILKQENANLLVLPSDHFIGNDDSFFEAVEKAISYSENQFLVTFGIEPVRAETAYGYIRKGKVKEDAVRLVEEFVEKPKKDIAQKYLDSGSYLWNSGIFVFQASSYLNELSRKRPDTNQKILDLMSTLEEERDFVRVNKASYETIDSESIDYAVMESAEAAIVISLDANWSDLGSWDAMHAASLNDPSNNSVSGDVFLKDTQNSLIRADSRLVVALGLDNLVVVETPDAVMVANMLEAQNIKTLVSELKQIGRAEASIHQKVYRPWGYYENLKEGPLYKVKRILVRSGESLSLQLHNHRSEHWVVVKGVARVTIEENVFELKENQSCFIPEKTRHRLQNKKQIDLEIIEVQTGSYLEEDDILRFDDEYGR